jgi:hypothetical protein
MKNGQKSIHKDAEHSESSSSDEEVTDLESIRKMVRSMIRPQIGIHFAN